MLVRVTTGPEFVCRRGEKSYQCVCLPDLVRSLLEPALCGVYSAVALVDVLLEIAHVVVFEAILGCVFRGFVLGLQWLAVDFGTWA